MKMVQVCIKYNYMFKITPSVCAEEEKENFDCAHTIMENIDIILIR